MNIQDIAQQRYELHIFSIGIKSINDSKCEMKHLVDAIIINVLALQSYLSYAYSIHFCIVVSPILWKIPQEQRVFLEMNMHIVDKIQVMWFRWYATSTFGSSVDFRFSLSFVSLENFNSW